MEDTCLVNMSVWSNVGPFLLYFVVAASVTTNGSGDVVTVIFGGTVVTGIVDDDVVVNFTAAGISDVAFWFDVCGFSVVFVGSGLLLLY